MVVRWAQLTATAVIVERNYKISHANRDIQTCERGRGHLPYRQRMSPPPTLCLLIYTAEEKYHYTAIDFQQLAYKLDRLVPRTMAIHDVREVGEDMHARFSAKKRTYRYFIHTRKDPFLRHYSFLTPYELDFELMNTAAALLKDYTDFGAFCKSHSDVKTTLCKVTKAEWIQTSPTQWYFEISADRFLRNMVRAVVGTLIDVGRHRLTIGEFRRVIEGGKRTAAGESMPGNALFLEKVDY